MLQEMRQKVRAMRQEMSDLQVNLRLKTMKTLKPCLKMCVDWCPVVTCLS
jgi:hypothetical protein